MSRTQLAALALAATTLSATGCGESPKTTTLTHAELIAKADPICARVNAKRASSTIRSREDYARLVPPLAAYEQTAVAELGKLIPPASMASDWKQVVAGAQTLANNTAKLGEYAKANNLAASRTLFSTDAKAQEQMLAAAKRIGFKDCAQT